MEYKEVTAKCALHQVKGGFPYKWDLNIYRGCEHNCQYCYAIYSHRYLDDENFFGTIYYKKNIAELLDQKLSSKSWKGEVINIGSVCDSYQPIEKELKLMRQVLKVMIKHKNPMIISTKSPLILRDLDLIQQLAEVTTVSIAFTITTVDEAMRRKIEPQAAPGIERFKALNIIKQKTKAVVGVHLMPIVPYYTDHYYNLRRIYKLASLIKVDYVLPGIMYLRGSTRVSFLNFVKEDHLGKYNKILDLYRPKRIPDDYRKGLYQVIAELEKEYGVSRDYKKALKLTNS